MADRVDPVDPVDRVGLGWRTPLAASIFTHLEDIDVVEVIADDYFKAPAKEVSALRTLATQVPLMLHGVAMGLASTVAVSQKRLDAMARLVDAVRPAAWSEHLAFVRGGGIEIGHLAAPPRTPASVDGAAANLDRARRAVGALPAVENIATLIDPPCSTLDEARWVRNIVEASGAPMLIDLHNLYANAVNTGQDPAALLAAMPLARVGMVHLSGGMWETEPGGDGQRLLDDHVHDVPDIVFDLLAQLAASTTGPLTVIIERDGAYPAFDHLLTQVAHARAALARGRARWQLAA